MDGHPLLYEVLKQESAKVSSRLRVIYPEAIRSFMEEQTRRKLVAKRPHRRVKIGDFLYETSSLERDQLRGTLAKVVIAYLQQERPIFLEGLGIVAPKSERSYATKVFSRDFSRHQETRRSATFEKCVALTSYHRQRFANVVDTHELSKSIFECYQQDHHQPWSIATCRQHLLGLIELIKYEVVIAGYSHQLNPLGMLYALHNRQGENLRDWFAGTDIFLQPRFNELVQTHSSLLFQRPIVSTPWEPFMAAYGPPVASFKFNIHQELSDFDCANTNNLRQAAAANNMLSVAVFQQSASNGTGPVLLYCTDGLRHLAQPGGDDNNLPCELTCQVNATDPTMESTALQQWPRRLLTWSWILLQSTQTKVLSPGLALTAPIPLFTTKDCQLDTILIAENKCLLTPQLTETGPFCYRNIIGITRDEARATRLHSYEHLMTLLSHRGFDQITKTTRSSVLSRTVLLSPSLNIERCLEDSFAED